MSKQPVARKMTADEEMARMEREARAKPTVGTKTFDSWEEAIAHATNLEMHGKISRRELNDVKTAAREAGHKS